MLSQLCLVAVCWKLYWKWAASVSVIFFWCEWFFVLFCFPEMLNIYKSQHFLNQGRELSTLMYSAWPHEVVLMLSMSRCGEVTPGVWALLDHHITTHYLGCGSPDPGTITNTISGLFVHFQEARRCHHHSAEEHLTHTAVVTSPWSHSLQTLCDGEIAEALTARLRLQSTARTLWHKQVGQ